MSKPSVDLHDIRPSKGKKADGFEELCAQLARVERPSGSRFVRKGTPDAGVECFATLEDGSEWGWHAKYFTSFGPKQWEQLDEPVITVLAKHPKLVRYFICIPLNCSDAWVAKKQSALQAWDSHMQKWHGWAAEAGRSIAFEHWGESEILDLLAQPAHVGRLRFWFDAHVFDEAWFAARLQVAIAAAGARYTRKALDRWAYDQQVILDFSRPGKPTDNPYIESFNGSFLWRVLERTLVSVADRCAAENLALGPGI